MQEELCTFRFGPHELKVTINFSYITSNSHSFSTSKRINSSELQSGYLTTVNTLVKGHDVSHAVLHSSDFTVNIPAGESEKHLLIMQDRNLSPLPPKHLLLHLSYLVVRKNIWEEEVFYKLTQNVRDFSI